MGILFGTDGVRGIANKELTPDIAYKLGKAGTEVLGSIHSNPRGPTIPPSSEGGTRRVPHTEAGISQGWPSGVRIFLTAGHNHTPILSYIYHNVHRGIF